jgi:hypothetical protein
MGGAARWTGGLGAVCGALLLGDERPKLLDLPLDDDLPPDDLPPPKIKYVRKNLVCYLLAFLVRFNINYYTSHRLKSFKYSVNLTNIL